MNNIPGWMRADELEFLGELAKCSRRIVEFGCYKGKSTRALADNSPDDAIIFAVDPWDGKYYLDNGQIDQTIDTDCYEEFENNLKDHIDSGKVVPCVMHSWAFYSPNVDMVFIDADHRYEQVKKDIEIGMNLLNQGGILAGHDYDVYAWPGVRKAVDEIFGKVETVNSIWHLRLT